MADPRLFFSAPDGGEGTQLQVFTSGQGSTRQLATLITPDDLPPGAFIPPGEFAGQMIFWDGTAWVPVPFDELPRVQGLTSIDPSPTQLQLNTGQAALIGESAQLNDNLANTVIGVTNSTWQAAFSDGATFTQILGDALNIILTTSGDAGGQVQINTFGVSQTQGTGWQVSLGEGADFVALDTIAGFEVLVEATLDLTLSNSNYVYQIQTNAHLFKTPDTAGDPQQNVTISHSGDDPSIGFMGVAPVTKRTVTNTNVLTALNSLLLGLSQLGLTAAAVVPTPAALRSVGYTAAAPLVLTVVAAGHTPGFYSLSVMVMVRTAGSAGSLARVVAFSTPNFGATTQATGSANITVVGSFVNQLTMSVYSDGVNAITETWTPAGVTGSPVIDITAQATFTGT